MPYLSWIGREAVVNHHQQVPVKTLVEGDVIGDTGTSNLLVHGDNLHALKALLPRFRHRVACVYIDPPYNTGNEHWQYSDGVNSPEMTTWLGQNVDRDDLTRHDKWLCMMYPRLRLLRDMLHPDDGSIWISIDDNEVHHLRSLMDEIFGRDRFVACNVWQKRYSRDNNSAIGDVHEYVMTYAMDPDKFRVRRNRLPIPDKSAAVYKNPNNDPRGPWRMVPMNGAGLRPNQQYLIKTTAGNMVSPPAGRHWSILEPEMLSLIAAGRVSFGKKGNGQPNLIRYLSENTGMVPWTWWPHEEAGDNDEAKKETMRILGAPDLFDTPKPLRLIERIINIATKPGDIVLDSFAGSGTTGHAVLSLNAKSRNEKQRSFVLVEMDRRIHDSATKVRLARASAGYRSGETDIAPLGGGVRLMSIGNPVFTAVGRIVAGLPWDELARFVWAAHTKSGLHAAGTKPLIGIHDGTAIYLIYDPADKTKNTLSSALVKHLAHPGPKVVYAESCTLAKLPAGLIYRQIPKTIKDV